MIILVMGVSGSGKTTIGQLLAETLHWQFSDADSFHSPENIEKMRHGIPLNDLDRMPWLLAMQEAMKKWLAENQNVVLACSALKASYREYLLIGNEGVKLIYLKGSFDLIRHRLHERHHHFMSEKLLKSQFDTLEEPSEAISIDISQSLAEIVQNIITALGI